MHFANSLLESSLLDKFRTTPYFYKICDYLNEKHEDIHLRLANKGDFIIVCDRVLIIGYIRITEFPICEFVSENGIDKYIPEISKNTYANQYD